MLVALIVVPVLVFGVAVTVHESLTARLVPVAVGQVVANDVQFVGAAGRVTTKLVAASPPVLVIV